MKPTNAKMESQQREKIKDGSSPKSPSPLPYTSSPSSNSSAFLMEKSEKKRREEKKQLEHLNFIGQIFSQERDAKSLRSEASRKAVVKSKSELSKDYCPYSSDNCGCSSGCTDCDYGLYTYTTKNKSKLKSKGKELYVRSTRPLKASERSRRTAKSFSTANVLRRKRAKLPKTGNALESCYPESSGSCDRKSDYIKCDFELRATKDRMLKTKRKKSARNSRKLKATRTVKLLRSKKVSKNTAAKVSAETVTKNWLPDSSNSCECNSGCSSNSCETSVTTRKKKLRNRFERARAAASPRVSELPLVINIESVKSKKVPKQTAGAYPKKRKSWPSYECSESDSYFTGEDCSNKCGNSRQSDCTKT
ncbi:PREDICTED: uncharacterized protein LOC105454534 [Wasmannia auropunctata]|uniref:uncharacterized protein LOC105454534 n=1 Tax=Wasmannia auropunctata TaxID=64793 RepID=UPI0005F030D9|nr:PREDICTED: uncharacterized protein LOC105454534 [Wasmannia auropunctata]